MPFSLPRNTYAQLKIDKTKLEHRMQQKTSMSKIVTWQDARHYEMVYRRWGIEDLLEHLGDGMVYVIIEDRSHEELRMNWQDAKMSKLEVLHRQY